MILYTFVENSIFSVYEKEIMYIFCNGDYVRSRSADH